MHFEQFATPGHFISAKPDEVNSVLSSQTTTVSSANTTSLTSCPHCCNSAIFAPSSFDGDNPNAVRLAFFAD